MCSCQNHFRKYYNNALVMSLHVPADIIAFLYYCITALVVPLLIQIVILLVPLMRIYYCISILLVMSSVTTHINSDTTIYGSDATALAVTLIVLFYEGIGYSMPTSSSFS